MNEEPESPRVRELQAEARRLSQDGKSGESLMLWVRIWEEKAAAWEAAGKPEYAAAERQQAERCRQRLADLDKPAIPPSVADVAALYRSMEAMRATPVPTLIPLNDKQYIIAPEHRTRPLSYNEAGSLMLKGTEIGKKKTRKAAGEWLAKQVDDGNYPCEHCAGGKKHIFDKRSFAAHLWPQISRQE